jgi:DNA-directed RNA polymerase specialized sigma24 family protein
MHKFESGNAHGSKWICGHVPVGKNKIVYIDSRTGEGIGEICTLMKKFVGYQSNKIKFPSMTSEDISQDLYLLALEAIPKYDITRNTNILTFLQGHIKNRLINKCKFVSEKKRRATTSKTNIYKVRCPSCKKFTVVEEKKNTDRECKFCGYEGRGRPNQKWKRYNIPVLPIPFTCIESKLPDEVVDITELFSNAQRISNITGDRYQSLDVEVQLKLDFKKIYDNLDHTNKTILSMLLEGYAYRDIAKEVGISEKGAYARVSKIISSNKLE